MKPLMSSEVFARHAWSVRLQALHLIRRVNTAYASLNASTHWLKYAAACAAQPGHPRRWRTSCLRATQQGIPTCAG